MRCHPWRIRFGVLTPDARSPEDRTMSEPLTVSIRREVDPERIVEATAWVQTG